MDSRWIINRTNPEYINYISKAASISPVTTQVLINRGLKTAAEINDFLSSGITSLSDPFELPGMKAAVERIKTALRHNERVIIHGDYDTDGLTATAIMVYALRGIGLDVHYFIPNRIIHGYGFNPPSVDTAKKLRAKLIITVDCGITSFDATTYAKKEGIDVIITDHHEPVSRTEDEKMGRWEDGGKNISTSQLLNLSTSRFLVPEAVALVNPKLSDSASPVCAYGTRDLSGAGIAFKVVQALAMENELRFSRDDLLSLLDLAALGTVADVVPLTGENRLILKEGMKYIHNARRPGIKSLKEKSGLNAGDIKAGQLLFTMVPRINAAGRMADAGDVIRLLLSDTDEEASELSSWLDRLNTERQRIEGKVYREALEKLRSSRSVGTVIVLADEGWHQGVVGIVASRIAEEFYKPTFILSIEDGIAKGSARSIPSFDICNSLVPMLRDRLLLSFGGHKQAAGIKLKAEDLPAFEKAMQKITQRSIRPDDLIPVIKIDADIMLSEVNHTLIKEFEMLEPLGYGNPKPLLGSKKLKVVSPRIVGNNHIKMKLCPAPDGTGFCSRDIGIDAPHGTGCIDAIGFDMGTLFENLDLSAATGTGAIDAVFTPSINEWNGGRYLQLILKAFRPSE